MKKAFLLYAGLFFPAIYSFSQSNGDQHRVVNLQYGVSFDLRWEIVYKYGYLSNFRFSVGAGIGAVLGKYLMPSAQYSIAAFQSGLGSSLSIRERYKINLESAFTLGLTGGNERNPGLYRRPLYTMGYLNPTPLYNPFNYYLTISSIYIARLTQFDEPNALGERRFNQRVGSATAGTPGIDINYYNDGFPYQWVGLGDGKDRYWTGGGFLNFHAKNRHDDPASRNGIRNIVFGFDRFTGHYPESFEVANAMRLGAVPYGDKSQAFFNKGRLFTGVELAAIPGLMPLFSFNDSGLLDVQDLIHRAKKQPIHRTLHTESFGLNLYYRRNYWELDF